MTVEPQTAHDKKLHEVADEYRRAGFEVTLEPDPKCLPFDLAGYRPDLIARKDDHGFIVEVKASAARMSVDRLRTVADEVAQHEGWRFLLVTADDDPGGGLPGINHEIVSWEEITARAEHAIRLNDMGEREAAYLLLWIAFEQMLRFHAEHASLPIERLAPSILIRHLYSSGELTMPQFDAALACEQTRNGVAHGNARAELPDAMQQLIQLIRELSTEWAPEFNSSNRVTRSI